MSLKQNDTFQEYYKEYLEDFKRPWKEGYESQKDYEESEGLIDWNEIEGINRTYEEQNT